MEKLLFNITLNTIIQNISTSVTQSNLKKEMQHLKMKRKRRTMLLFNLQSSSYKRSVPKVVRYMKIVESYPDDIFYSHFRMTRPTFVKLFNMLKTTWPRKKIGRPSIDLKYSIYLTLWFLCNKNSLRELSDRFGIAKGSVYKCVKKTCKVIFSMKSELIKWPLSNEIDSIVNKFNNLRSDSFPGIISCIDCTHVQIPTPLNDAMSYYNRKGFYSIIIQAACDSDFIFRDVFIGWPGRSHDAGMWKCSPLYKGLEDGRITLPQNVHLV